MPKLFSRLSLLLLIAFNLYFIWYYRQHPDGLKTLFVLYWLQSVSLGFFTFLLLLTAKPTQGTANTSAAPADVQPTGSRGCMALFFMVHYGAFHLVYLVFIVAGQKGSLDFAFIKLSAIVILLAEFMEFRRKKDAIDQQPDIARLSFFLPYLRIVPMHLVLLGISFFNWGNITSFLMLKTIADVAMHLLTNALYFRQPTNEHS